MIGGRIRRSQLIDADPKTRIVPLYHYIMQREGFSSGPSTNDVSGRPRVSQGVSSFFLGLVCGVCTPGVSGRLRASQGVAEVPARHHRWCLVRSGVSWTPRDDPRSLWWWFFLLKRFFLAI